MNEGTNFPDFGFDGDEYTEATTGAGDLSNNLPCTIYPCDWLSERLKYFKGKFQGFSDIKVSDIAKECFGFFREHRIRGLPVCNWIVNSHRGFMTRHSQQGRGSIFILIRPEKQF
jgi:hypothetical protein